MPFVRTLISIATLSIAIGANAELKNLDKIISKAASRDNLDLEVVLKQIRLVPAKDPATGKPAMKVMSVDKGSFYEQEGIRVGDLLTSRTLGSTDEALEISNSRTPKTSQ